jgi:putative glutathione S-transferase
MAFGLDAPQTCREYTVTAESPYASPVDIDLYGPYQLPVDSSRPVYRFDNRITADGTSGFAAEPGRYHVYAGAFCPWAQRVAISRALLGLENVVSLSYVDRGRDARGWGFRQSNGPDPVNGFQFLRQAYDATTADYDGHVSVPTLWDRRTGQVVSNRYDLIGLDLATEFGAWVNPGVELYPEDCRDEIDELDRWLGPDVNKGAHQAAGQTDGAVAARALLLKAFDQLDQRLEYSRYLTGASISEADIRLWVTLIRFDATANADRKIVSGLDAFPNLWAYARDLYAHPAFASTTDFSSFTTDRASLLDWNAPSDREHLGQVSA